MTPSLQIDENNNEDLRPSKEKGLEKSIVKEYELSFWEKFAIQVIKCGPIPQHVAFIMDGNRRYARQKKLSSTIEGHTQGYSAMANIVSFCGFLEVQEVT